MKDVRKTAAYKAILPAIREEDRKAFTKAMQVMFERGESTPWLPFFDATPAAPPSDVLLNAFWWDGLDGTTNYEVQDFWSELHDRLCDAERDTA